MEAAEHAVIGTSMTWFKVLVFTTLMLPVLLIIYAGVNDIVLYLDAAYYLQQNLVHESFVLVEPSSRSVQVLQQWPVLLAIQLGVDDLQAMKLIAGCWNLLLPLTLTALIYPIIPARSKWLFVFPLAAYVGGSLASFFPTITDAPPASGYFWLLMFMVLYAERLRWGWLATLLLALPAMYLHESLVFLGPLLLIAAAFRLLHPDGAGRLSPGRVRTAFYVILIVCFLLATMLALQHIIEPRSVANRSGFLTGLLEFKWYSWHGEKFNTAAILSVYGLPLMFLLWLGSQFAPASFNRHYAPLLIVNLGLLFAVFALVLAVLIANDARLYGVGSQFAARAHATLVSFPLAILLLLSVFRGAVASPLYVRGMAILLVLMSLASCLSHYYGIKRWDQFTDAFQASLGRHQGYVSWSQAFSEVPYMYEFGSAWTNQITSLMLSRHGQVEAIIDNRQGLNLIDVFDPCALAALPASTYFDFSSYRAHVRNGVCRGVAQKFAAPLTSATAYRIDFKDTLAVMQMAELVGFSYAKPWGRRIEGEQARLLLTQPLPQHFTLRITARSFAPDSGQHVTVAIGKQQARFTLTQDSHDYLIPFHLQQPAATIRFQIPAPTQPADLGSNADRPRQRIGLIAISIEPAATVPPATAPGAVPALPDQD